MCSSLRIPWEMQVQEVPFAPARALEAVDAVPVGEILLVVGNFAEEAALASVLLARPWRFAAFVGAGVEEVLATLDERREGLLGSAQWVARTALPPDEGPDAHWFAAHYRKVAGSEPPYAAAQAFAAGVLSARCLRETGDPDEALIQAKAVRLTCRTLFGRFQLDPHTGLQTGHQVVVVQWQQGKRRVVWPPEQAECALIGS